MRYHLMRYRPLTPRAAVSGMTLMEVMVACFIFVVSVLGYSKLQSGLFHQGIDNTQRSIAVWKAEELIDLISANNTPAALTLYADAVSDADACAVEPVNNCIESADAKTSAACAVDELVAYDVWNTLCAEGAGSVERLVNFAAELECNNVCGDEQGMTLRFSWLSVTVDGDMDLHDANMSKEEGGDAMSKDSLTLVFRP
ncbi:MAG: hypothetical protein KTR33_04305 [Gammaproteobacteria bacterium]|nr:hypothetical protein [Gammaproteobacteria bacterium]